MPTRGFGAGEFREVGEAIARVLDGLTESPEDNDATEARVREAMRALCRRFPIYPEMRV